MTGFQSFFFSPVHLHRCIFLQKIKMAQDCPQQNYRSHSEVCLNLNYKICRVSAVPLQSFSSEYNWNTNRSGAALQLKTCSKVFDSEQTWNLFIVFSSSHRIAVLLLARGTGNYFKYFQA